MKQHANREYDEWQQHREENAKKPILRLNIRQCLCTAQDMTTGREASASSAHICMMKCQYTGRLQHKGIQFRLKISAIKNSAIDKSQGQVERRHTLMFSLC